MTGVAARPETAVRLPELRQDLNVVDPGADADGTRHWLIYDPVRHRYCEVDATGLELLQHWRAGLTLAEFVAAVERETGKRVTIEQAGEFLAFAGQEYLLADPSKGDWRSLAEIAKRGRPGIFRQTLHSYLFFRIPLIHPQAFLQRTLWIARMLASPSANAVIAGLGLVGLYLVSRQWDEFQSTFASLWSVEGALSFAVALILVKIIHELGHAYTAVGSGCRVPTMGVAFMVMTPILYTDVTDAWRLGSRRKRLAIDAAGVVAELKVAAFATFLWPFLPPGTLKAIVFVIATTSWVMSLAINLNPFMRFDGYYILGDLMGVQNLQPRAFALARWRMRQFLFGLDEPPPELLADRRRRWLIAYAYATWIYRLTLFIGIALLVYHYFFKALGIALFVVEIVFFIARPIWIELLEWKKRMPQIRSRPRAYATLAVLGILMAAAVVPWSSRVDIPVVIEPVRLARIYPPQSAEISSLRVAPGQPVKAGDVLVEMRSQQIENELALVESRIRASQVRLARLVADRGDREQSIILGRELQSLKAKRSGLQEVVRELMIRAPLDGEVVELAPTLHAGRYVAKSEQLMVIADLSELQARGYVGESDVSRIATGDRAKFIAGDGRMASLPLSVAQVGLSGADKLEISDLSSVHGGAVDAVETRERQIVSSVAQYPVRFSVGTMSSPVRQRVRGLAVVAGDRQSYAARMWRQVLRIAVREGGL